MKKKVGKDLLLAFLYAEGRDKKINEAIWGRTRLEKMMFIFEKELADGFYRDEDISLPEFIPYLYGPYSMELLDDLTLFISIDFIDEAETSVAMSPQTANIENRIENENDDLWDEINSEDGQQYEKMYSLTNRGIQYTAENIWCKLTTNQKSVIIRLKTQVNNMLLDDLLSYVYRKYPEYAEKSLIKHKYIEKRI